MNSVPQRLHCRPAARLGDINKRTLGKVSQQLRAAQATNAENYIRMIEALDFLSRFAPVFQAGHKHHKDRIVEEVRRVPPHIEAGIQAVFSQTEAGNLLVVVAENGNEVRFLTYSEMWDRANAMQFE